MRAADTATPAVAHWHPDVRLLHDDWRSLRPGDGGLPARRDIDPAQIVRLLPGIWMLDVHRAPFRLRYRLAGTAVVAAHQRELTGLWFDEAHEDLPGNFFERYRAVVETHEPSWRRGPPFLDKRSFVVSVLENVVLPLASDGDTVDILLCFTKVYRHPDEVPR